MFVATHVIPPVGSEESGVADDDGIGNEEGGNEGIGREEDGTEEGIGGNEKHGIVDDEDGPEEEDGTEEEGIGDDEVGSEE